MKTIVPSILVMLVCVGWVPAAEENEQAASFPGVRKAMPRSEYEAAGLEKLTPEERAQLDAYIRSRVSRSNKRAADEAAAAAVDRAVYESRGEAPRIIESRIAGPFTGYYGHTTFTLENGQKWTQCQPESGLFPKVDHPRVVIRKGLIGYRMFIVGGSDIRVQPLTPLPAQHIRSYTSVARNIGSDPAAGW